MLWMPRTHMMPKQLSCSGNLQRPIFEVDMKIKRHNTPLQLAKLRKCRAAWFQLCREMHRKHWRFDRYIGAWVLTVRR